MMITEPYSVHERTKLELEPARGRLTQSRMSTPGSERPNRKPTNDGAPVRERADRKRMEGQGGLARVGAKASVASQERSVAAGPVDGGGF